jgi:hypothetical protein
MVTIYINNQLADFFGSLTIKKDNPLLAKFDVEPTEHTYTLTLPTTATNAKIFSLIQHTLATPQKLPARIEVDGVQVLEGSCNVQSWSKSGYSVYFSGIAPYEDANISPIKKMLGDTRLLGDILTFEPQLEIPNGVGEYSGYNGNVVAGDANTFFLNKDNELVEGVVTSNVCFNVKYLIDNIAEYYGIEIDNIPVFGNLFVCQLGEKDVYPETFEGVVRYKVRLQTSVPKLTPMQLLTNVASACGYKMRVNYKNNRITFASLNDIPHEYTSINSNLTSINYNSTPVEGVVKFKEVPSLKYKNEQGVELQRQYSTDDKVIIGVDDSKKFFDNMLSKMIVPAGTAFPNAVIMPVNYDDKDDRFENIALVGYDADNKYIVAPNCDMGNLELWQAIANRHTSIKLTARINPIQFTTLNIWQPIYVDNVGKIFVKSISFKSDGESDIEGYLY